MPAVDLSSNTITALANAFAKSVQSSGSLSTGGSSFTPSQSGTGDRASDMRSELMSKDMKEASKYMKTASNDFATANKISNKLFASAIQGIESVSRMDKLPDAFEKHFANTSSDFVKSIAGSVTSLEDMFGAQAQIENLPAVKELLNEFKDGARTWDSVVEEMDGLGFSVNTSMELMTEFGNVIDADTRLIKTGSEARKEANSVIDKFDKETKDASKSLFKFSKETTQATEGLAKMKEAGGHMKAAGSILLGTAKQIHGVASEATKFGVQLDVSGAAMRGMPFGEWAENLHSSRQAVLSLTGGLGEFKEIVSSEAAVGIRMFTGSMAAATKGLSSMVQTSRMLGDSSMDSASFVSQQSSLFGRLNKTLSMTIDEFSNMNSELVNDSEIRGVMVRLNEKERTQMFTGLQQSYEYFRSQGLLHEQSMALVKSMKAQAGEDPLEALKKGAGLRALAGSVGQGDVGQELMDLMIAGPNRTAEEDKRFAELGTQVSQAIEEKRGKGEFGGRAAMSTMIKATGIEEELARFRDLNLATGAKAQDETMSEMANQTAIAGMTDDSTARLLGVADQGFAFLQGPYFTAVLAMKAAVTGLVTGITAMALTAGGIAAAVASIPLLPGILAVALGAALFGALYKWGKPLMDWIGTFNVVESVGGFIQSVFEDDDETKDRLMKEAESRQEKQQASEAREKNTDKYNKAQLNLTEQLVKDGKENNNLNDARNKIQKEGMANANRNCRFEYIRSKVGVPA